MVTVVKFFQYSKNVPSKNFISLLEFDLIHMHNLILSFSFRHLLRNLGRVMCSHTKLYPNHAILVSYKLNYNYKTEYTENQYNYQGNKKILL